jgi:hypothetical protein
VAAWEQRSDRAGRVVHLGLGVDGAAPWNALPELVSLGALFEMLQAQSEMRRRQIERARRACLEKALAAFPRREFFAPAQLGRPRRFS